MVEETEVREAERLVSVPVDMAVRLLAGAACPASVTVCDDYIVMSGAIGTLSPSDSDSIGPVGTLSPSYSVFVGHDGPVGPVALWALCALLGRCPRLTLLLLALWALLGRCLRLTLCLLAMMALMGRCPHPILPECCFRPFLLEYRSQ